MTAKRRTWLAIPILLTVGAYGQAQVANPPADTGSGDKIETDFDLTIGGVIVDGNGNQDKFRTDRNIRSGFDIADLYLNFRPVSGAQTFFDFMTLSATGIGNSSPYQRAQFEATKRKLYELKAGYRKYNYFFGLPEFAAGWHPEDSVGRTGNISLELFPDRKVSVFGGYRRHQLYGTRFTSQNLTLDTYPVSFPRRLSSDEIFGGAKLTTRTVSLKFTQSYIRLKDDQQLFPNSRNPFGLRENELISGQRNTPSRISTPISRVLGRYQPNRRYDLIAQYMYSGADLDLSRQENLLQQVGTGAFPTRQLIASTGTSTKPTHNANFAQSLGVTNRLTFHHRFAYETYSLTGFLNTTGVLSLINQENGPDLDLPFQEAGGTITEYRLARNEMELDYAVVPSVSLLGAYRYTDRHLAFGAAGSNPRPVVTIGNTGIGGLLWRPSAKGRLRAEVEKGSASLAFNRIDPLSTLRWKVRGSYRPVTRLTISGSLLLEDNSNNTPDVNHDLDNRQLGLQAVYVPSTRLLVSGGYNYLRIRTSTDIVFYALSQLTQGTSLYETNTHVAHFLLRVPVYRRIELRGGYEYVKDTGSTYPLRMHVPHAGVSVKLYESLHFEADWRYYSYAEQRSAIRDYNANVVALGLRFTR